VSPRTSRWHEHTCTGRRRAAVRNGGASSRQTAIEAHTWKVSFNHGCPRRPCCTLDGSGGVCHLRLLGIDGRPVIALLSKECLQAARAVTAAGLIGGVGSHKSEATLAERSTGYKCSAGRGPRSGAVDGRQLLPAPSRSRRCSDSHTIAHLCCRPARSYIAVGRSGCPKSCLHGSQLMERDRRQ
jgi:hypothetical protein